MHKFRIQSRPVAFVAALLKFKDAKIEFEYVF
jgi:hypothetical protein